MSPLPEKTASMPWSLRSQITGIVLLLQLAITLAFLLVLQPRLRHELEARELQRLVARATAVATTIDREFRSARTELEAAARIADIRRMNPERADALLRVMDATSSHFIDYTLLDARGRILLRPTKPERQGSDRSDRDYFRIPMATGRTHFGAPRISTAGNRSFSAGTPVRDDRGVILGVLVASLGAQDRNPALYSSITDAHLPQAWEVALFDKEGRVLARSAGLSDSAEEPDGFWRLDSLFAGAHLGAAEPWYGTRHSERWIGASARLREVELMLVVVVPRAQVDALVRGILAPMWLLMGLLMLAVFIIGLILADHVARPVETLSKVLHDYGVSGFAAPLPEPGNREVALLFRSFTAMIRERSVAEAIQKRLLSMLDATPDFIGISDPNGRVLYINPAGRQMIGRSRHEDLSSTRISELHPDESGRMIFEEAIPAALRDGSWHGESILRAGDGREIPVSQVVLAHRDQHGEVEFLSTVARDLTMIRRLEHQFLQSQKLESIGRLAGGIAHDFNNLLMVTMGNAERLARQLAPGSVEADEARAILDGSKRAAALTRQLLAFARKQPIEPRVIDAAAVVGGMEVMLKHLLQGRAQLQLSRPERAAVVLMDPVQLEQVLLNLAVNARDAMPKGGVLTIEIREDEAAAHAAGGETPAEIEPPGVLIAVSDTGTGMDEEVQARLFEPFFSTKPKGEGTGLGLASCYGIVTQAGGRLSVRSELGLGSTFNVHLPGCSEPLSRPEPVAIPMAGPTTDRSSENLRILIVEDEVKVRELLQRAIGLEGHDVTVAGSPREAIEIAQREAAFDVLLSDIVLPGMSGIDLAHDLRARFPKMRIILMSGYNDRPGGKDAMLPPDCEFIGKPFSLASLVQRLSTRQAPGPGPADS